MNITECSKQLRKISKAHANYSISVDTYRYERKQLLDNLDLNINGVTPFNVTSHLSEATVMNNGDNNNTVPHFDKNQHESTGVEANEVNGKHVEFQQVDDENELNQNDVDKTQPYFAGKIDKCLNFIKGSNNR
ncbi:hypothetical protein [Colwellia echini]|uniref:Uncharacterized protein n=1 Tax=Colwellia echini TaxID=1982103 RepID=A0ABY3MW40_9GAMM|nr:hypothetical protein [Colwellia echini]TYK65432.1 hypothetical protein CWS31_010065 [Colwellia echini]